VASLAVEHELELLGVDGAAAAGALARDLRAREAHPAHEQTQRFVLRALGRV
jgi:hypothetical protein